jgi:hypothetical protein
MNCVLNTQIILGQLQSQMTVKMGLMWSVITVIFITINSIKINECFDDLYLKYAILIGLNEAMII